MRQMPPPPNSPHPSCCPPPPYCPPPPCLPPEPSSPQAWDYGFQRLVSFIQSPSLGAGILAITIFLLIVLSSNAILATATFATLGITVTLATLAFMAIVILLLFIL